MRIRPLAALLLLSLMAVAISVAAQETEAPKAPNQALQGEDPAANPGRPTVSTPATLTPVGYLQFETGYLGAWHSPEFSSQSSFNEVVKFSVTPRIELLAAAGLFAHSLVENQISNGAGGVAFGVQGVAYQGEGARPTIAFSYFREVYAGSAPDLDLGSPKNAILLLAAKYGVPVCPHAGGVGLCELVRHLSMFDFVAVSGTQADRAIEWVDHLHHHFVDPAIVRDGRYLAPTTPGFSARMYDETLARYAFPDGPEWRDE